MLVIRRSTSFARAAKAGLSRVQRFQSGVGARGHRRRGGAGGAVARADVRGAVKHAGLDNIVAIVRRLADKTKSPVALHLDHGKSEELARAAVDAGYTSVMIDASRESFEENVRETRHIVAYAHAVACTWKPSSARWEASRTSVNRPCARC